MEAYSFLVDNYNEGDEIFLFGWSRGAYTARALSGFILWCGIMTKPQLAFIRPIYQASCRRSPSNPELTDWAAEVLFRVTGRWPSVESSRVEGVEFEKHLGSPPAPAADPVSSGGAEANTGATPAKDSRSQGMGPKQGSFHSTARLEAEASGACVVPPKIKFIGCLDTVGALGVPGQFGTRWAQRKFSFFDTGLSSNVEVAYQALALSENRKDFTPTLWDRYDPNSTQRMKEVWFAGSHGDVGGGHPQHGLSDVVLANLVAHLTDFPQGGKPRLALDIEHVKRVQDRTFGWAKQEPYRSRHWFTFRKARQVCENLEEKKEAAAAAAEGLPEEGSDDGRKPEVWANEEPSGPNREFVHHSVVISGRFDPARSEEFKTLRERDPEQLQLIWARASDPNTLLPTERYLRWEGSEGDAPTADGASSGQNPRVPPLSVSWARAPSNLSPNGIRRYIALKDALVHTMTGIKYLSQVVTWPVVVALNTVVTRQTSTENLAGKPPAKPGQAAVQEFKRGVQRVRDAIAVGKKANTEEKKKQ